MMGEYKHGGGLSPEDEKFVLDFIFSRTDVVAFRKALIDENSSVKKFPITLNNLKEDLIKNENSYYYFNLSEKIKSLLLKEGLMFECDENTSFFGFQDPIFCKNGKVILSVRAIKGDCFFVINDREKEELEKAGLYLVEYPIHYFKY